MNPLRGEATFAVQPEKGDPETYRLRFTWNAAAEFEAAAGKTITETLLHLEQELFSARTLRAMLWAGLREYHPKVSLEDAGRLIDRAGHEAAQRVLGEALKHFFLDPDKAAEPTDPEPGPAGPPTGTATSAPVPAR